MASSSTTTTMDSLTLAVNIDGKKGVLKLSNSSKLFAVFPVSSKGTIKSQPTLSTSIRNVLWSNVSASANTLVISTLAKKSSQHVLVQVSATFDSMEEGKAVQFSEQLMRGAYEGVSQKRKFKVLVNPVGGKGQAKKIYEKRVKPILDAAQSSYDTEFTTHRFHAEEIATALPLKYDAILALSGDGLPHEILNGLASRVDARAALRTPVVPVPTGSANAFNINLMGVKNTFDVGLAVLNAIKGSPMDLDLLSVVQDGKRRWSFISQAFGLMADLDLGTEQWRWMGDTRFMLGYVRGIISPKSTPLSVSIKVQKSGKADLLEDYVKHTSTPSPPASLSNGTGTENNTANGHNEPALDLLADKYIDEKPDAEGWIEFNRSILYIYGGIMPYVAADLMQFPLAVPHQGAIDLVVQELVSRGTMVSMIDGAEKGSQFWLKQANYYKALAFRVTPIPKTKPGFISIDGEAAPYVTTYVEAHKGLARTMSLHGGWQTEFDPTPPKGKKDWQ